ncbi:carbonic anhydrase [Loktanella sp. DJP18]|uniref:carbonic anhydrase n=1 Tax=Loktanella sp. DJP18 TaxID=3409788 RepID=UPI003BB6C9B3
MLCRFFVLLGLIAFTGAAHAANWGYDGAHGPDHWAELSGDNAICASGRFQSPFNIVPDIEADMAALDIHYGSRPVEVTNNGHTLVTAGGPEDHVGIGGVDWKLLQFHFHTPSEYMIDGQSFPMEVHFVHQAADGRLAVIGAMIAEGPANPAIAELWNVAPYDHDVTNGGAALISLRDLLPDNQEYMRFMGSLTTSPCTEGINWHMLMTPITASAEQIAAFRSVFPNNARPIQPRNGRLVVAEH